MKQNIPELSAYLSISKGKWTVIHKAMPLCRDGTEENARSVAVQNNVQTEIIWDGDKGCFVICE